VSKENKLGLISVRQMRLSDTEIYIKEISSHEAGPNVVSPPYPTYENLNKFRKFIANKCNLVGLLNDYDNRKRLEIGIQEGLISARQSDNGMGKTFIEDWEKPARCKDIKVRL